MKKNKAFFFDRDGILNKSIIKNNKPYSPTTPDHLKLNKELVKFIKNLKKKNFIIIVITNQPEISRGKLSKFTSSIINNLIMRYFSIDAIYVCSHDDKDKCRCRKPKNGMLLQAEKDWNIDLKQSYFVGDRWKDIKAGSSLDCKTIFIDYKYSEKKPKNYNYKFNLITNMIKNMEKIL